MPAATRVTEAYPEIAEVLNPRLRRLSSDDIEALLEAEGIDAEDLESFLKTLKQIGRVAASALPTVAPIVGGLVGGPLGAAAGTALGGVAGKALAGALGPAQPGPAVAGQRPVQRPPRMGGGVLLPDAARLMQFISNPQTLQALASLFLGPAGRPSVPVAGRAVPVGAFANTMSILANQAAAEHYVLTAGNGEQVPEYVVNYAGELEGDPSLPEYRAMRLLELLAETDLEADEAESDESDAEDEAESYFALRRANDNYYDAIDRAELYAAGGIW